jgi:hypothetical protein
MHQGQTLRVNAIPNARLPSRDPRGLDPEARSGNSGLPGNDDVLVVAKDSFQNGDTPAGVPANASSCFSRTEPTQVVIAGRPARDVRLLALSDARADVGDRRHGNAAQRGGATWRRCASW